VKGNRPAPITRLFDGEARIVQPAPVEKLSRPIEIGRPSQRRNRVDDSPILVLRRIQWTLRQYPITRDRLQRDSAGKGSPRTSSSYPRSSPAHTDYCILDSIWRAQPMPQDRESSALLSALKALQSQGRRRWNVVEANRRWRHSARSAHNPGSEK
jgi:hypothetical protein